MSGSNHNFNQFSIDGDSSDLFSHDKVSEKENEMFDLKKKDGIVNK